MAYIPKECSIEQYRNAIYNEDAKHKLYVKVGETELVDVDDFCEKLTFKNRSLSNGSKTFSLDHFVSNEIELILHDYIIQDLTQEIEIKIGTYIEDLKEYVNKRC